MSATKIPEPLTDEISFLKKENEELWAKNERLTAALLLLSKQAREAAFPYLKDHNFSD